MFPRGIVRNTLLFSGACGLLQTRNLSFSSFGGFFSKNKTVSTADKLRELLKNTDTPTHITHKHMEAAFSEIFAPKDGESFHNMATDVAFHQMMAEYNNWYLVVKYKDAAQFSPYTPIYDDHGLKGPCLIVATHPDHAKDILAKNPSFVVEKYAGNVLFNEDLLRELTLAGISVNPVADNYAWQLIPANYFGLLTKSAYWSRLGSLVSLLDKVFQVSEYL